MANEKYISSIKLDNVKYNVKQKDAALLSDIYEDANGDLTQYKIFSKPADFEKGTVFNINTASYNASNSGEVTLEVNDTLSFDVSMDEWASYAKIKIDGTVVYNLEIDGRNKSIEATYVHYLTFDASMTVIQLTNFYVKKPKFLLKDQYASYSQSITNMIEELGRYYRGHVDSEQGGYNYDSTNHTFNGDGSTITFNPPLGTRYHIVINLNNDTGGKYSQVNYNNQFWVLTDNPIVDITTDGSNFVQLYLSMASNIKIDTFEFVGDKVYESGIITGQKKEEYDNAASITYVDTALDGKLNTSGGILTGDLDVSQHSINVLGESGSITISPNGSISGVTSVSNSTDAANKNYVDTKFEEIKTTKASDDSLGLVKTNSAQSIRVDETGKLIVGGRMGQFPNGGIYYPPEADPTSVGAYSFLITDGAKNLSVTSRTLSIMAGCNVTLRRSAAPGTTEYHVLNSVSNRFYCAVAAQSGSRVSINQADAAENGTRKVISCTFANGGTVLPHFGPNEPDNDIIITVAESANPETTITTLRIYGTTVANDVITMGQGCVGHSKGISIGQACVTAKQQTIAAGNSVYVSDTNSFGLGNLIYIPRQYCFATGYGHDFTNASHGTSAFGISAAISDDTIAAFGAGKSTPDAEKVNAFEVKRNGDIIVGGVANYSSVPATTTDTQLVCHKELNDAIGDIDTALDNIIALQNSYINGGASS